MSFSDNLFLNVKNKEILKEIFSNLEFKAVLKLIKYNKVLQNKLEITKGIFMENSDLPKYEYNVKTDIIIIEKIKKRSKNITFDDTAMFDNIFFTPIFFLFILIYYIISVSSGHPDESNIKENYEPNSLDKINCLNKSLFYLIFHVFTSFFINIFFICHKSRNDFGCKKYLKEVFIIYFISVHIIFEGLVIWKIKLFNEIKSISVTWFMVLDYLFAIIHFLYIILLYNEIVLFFKNLGKNVRGKSTEINLISYNKIKIKNYELPKEFITMDKTKKKKYITENIINFQYEISKEQMELVNLINSYRRKYQIKKYIFKKIPKIPKEMYTLPSEAVFFDYRNIFKIGRNKYIIKYPVGELKKRLLEENEEIINIIKKDNLNHIHIIKREPENEYIYLWQEEKEEILYYCDIYKDSDFLKKDKYKYKHDPEFYIKTIKINLKDVLFSE